MKMIFAAALCTTAIISQISTASAQNYWPRGYGPGGWSPPEPYYDQFNLRNQPMRWGDPYPATQLPNGRISCTHRNYRPISGRCQRLR